MTMVRLLLGTAMPLLALTASAEEFADPTRPPPDFQFSSPVQGGVPVATEPNRLQSIIRRAGAKPAAMINGEWVALDGKVGEARLVRIREDSVDLRTEAGMETLRLTPEAAKMPAAGITAGADRRLVGRDGEKAKR